MYGHLPPLSQTIKGRRTRNTEHFCKNKEELISVLLWSLTYGHTSVNEPAETYINSLRTLDTVLRASQTRWLIEKDGDKRRNSELLVRLDERERERERERVCIKKALSAYRRKSFAIFWQREQLPEVEGCRACLILSDRYSPD